MQQEFTREQFWQIFEKLPKEVQNLIFSEETAVKIFDACEENGVDVEKIPQVGKYVGRVLIGMVPANEFQNILEKEVGLKKNIAGNIAQEINKTIFSQIGKAPAKEEKKPPKKADAYRESIE